MKLYLVRHGEPSYTPCTQRGLIGQGRDLSALNDNGIKQMSESALKLVNKNAQIILSSPYTRALQSAAIVAKYTGLTTRVVHDLHEWIPDLTFQYQTYKELKLLYEDFVINKGVYPVDEHAITAYTRWEPLEDLKMRVKNALIPFCSEYERVIVVAHGMVIQTFRCQDKVGFGEIIEVAFDQNFVQPKWSFQRTGN